MAQARICSIENCNKSVFCRGWCYNHYYLWRANGDPTIARRASNGALEKFINEVAIPYQGDGCLIWPFTRNKQGYGTTWRNGKTMRVSRIVCEATHGPPPSPDMQAAHECGRGHRGCVSPRHLTWKTRLENAKDCIRHGTTRRGERNWCSKLTEQNVRKIRQLIADGEMQTAIAHSFGVTKATISDIKHRRIWAWLP